MTDLKLEGRAAMPESTTAARLLIYDAVRGDVDDVRALELADEIAARLARLESLNMQEAAAVRLLIYDAVYGDVGHERALELADEIAVRLARFGREREEH